MRTVKIMYNEDQKKKYIDYEGTNTQTLITYFKRLSDKEREHDKDILNMSLDELKDTLISLGIRREESRRHLLSLLRGYVNWGILNSIISHSDISQITAESISSQEAIRLKMLKSPEQLRSILENELDFVNYENRSKRDSLIFWLLYSGIPMDDLYRLKKDSINVDNKTVKLDSGDVYEITDEIVELWYHCSNITFLERKNSLSKTANAYWQSGLVNSDFLFRATDKVKLEEDINEERLSTDDELSVKSKDNKGQYLENAVKKIIDSYSESIEGIVRIPPRNIRLSGLFYKMLCLEREGTEVTAETIAFYLKIPYNNQQELSLSTRKWRVDYEDWKLAFGYMNESINLK